MRVEGPRQWGRQPGGNPRLHHQRITSCWGKPAHPSHHCDALEVRTPDRSDPVKDVTGWPANPNLVRHLKSTLIWTGVHVDEAVMGLSVHTDEDGGGDNPLLGGIQLRVPLELYIRPLFHRLHDSTCTRGSRLSRLLGDRAPTRQTALAARTCLLGRAGWRAPAAVAAWLAVGTQHCVVRAP